MERDERALEYFSSGCNCAQAVLAGCSDMTGLDERQSLTVAGGFGGGLACGEVCGALCGAVLALGALFPYADPEDAAAKTRLRAVSQDACERFREEFGCLTCRELQDKYGGKSRCPEFVQFCTQLVEEMWEECGNSQ